MFGRPPFPGQKSKIHREPTISHLIHNTGFGLISEQSAVFFNPGSAPALGHAQPCQRKLKPRGGAARFEFFLPCRLLSAFKNGSRIELSSQVLPAPCRRRAAQQSCQDMTSHVLTTSQLQSSRHASCRHHSSCSTRPRLQRDHHHVSVEHCAAADLLSSHRIMLRRRVRDLSA